jgi:hypothetical protein
MSDTKLQFQGDVQVYLEGREALEPISECSEGCMAYYVASPESLIEVRDFRRVPSEAAKCAMAGQSDVEFASVFSKPAWVKVHSSLDRAEIELHESRSSGNGLTLWLGVIMDDRMPVHQVQWEILKPVNETTIAFAALVH